MRRDLPAFSDRHRPAEEDGGSVRFPGKNFFAAFFSPQDRKKSRFHQIFFVKVLKKTKWRDILLEISVSF